MKASSFYYNKSYILNYKKKKGMAKLMGLDYSIQYKWGKENVATDALSRCQEESSSTAIIVVVPEWCQEVIGNYANDE